MAVSKKAKALYNKIFDGTETAAANTIMTFQVRKTLKKAVKSMPDLTAEQKRIVRDYWKPYLKVDTDWVRYYTHITGKFDPRYIPNDLQYTKIDQHFCNRKLGYGFNDKNYYSLLFSGIKQPTTVIRKIGGLLFDAEYCQIDIAKAKELLALRTEVIVKPTQESGSGRNIHIYHTVNDSKQLECLLNDKSETNIIIQDLVKQHYELFKMHPQSLNTVRVYTLMLEDGVHILSSSLKMGANESRIDNVSANSGIAAGIRENGELMDCAYFDMHSGKTTDRHPQGMPLSEIKIPHFEQLLDATREAARYVGNFRLVGWDMSVDENGEIILIEANMRKGAIGPHQCQSGPFYGDLTERVLDEVFGRNKK